MENKRKGLFAVLIIGCLMTLIGTAMSSSFELGIVIGIVLVYLSRKALRIQENHEFISTSDPSGQWTLMKREAGVIFCVIGITMVITTTAVIGITINIATVIGTIVFLSGLFKLAKPRVLSHHTDSVVKAMRFIGFPPELISKTQSLKRQRVAA